MNEEWTTAARNGVPGHGDLNSAKTLTTLVYLLQALGLFLFVPWIAAVVINHVKWDDIQGTWLTSHFRWQMRTFWFSLLWWGIGVVTSLVLVGYLVLFFAAIWTIYRVVKGWLYLSEGREMYR
jgi:uncharacterized membrane protein